MDLKTELQNFKTINLDGIEQGEMQISDNIRNSIFLYNKAIESLKSGSEDIAVIELKKAVSMNPQFNEAMNLLGICYGYLGDKEKAAEVFNKVIKSESNSILAMNCMKRLGLTEPDQAQKNWQPSNSATKKTESLKRIRTPKTPETGIHFGKNKLISAAKIFAGFALGVLLTVFLFLSLPKNEIEQITPAQSSAGTIESNEKAEYEAQLKELKDKNDLLQKDKDTVMQQTEYYKAIIKLYEIETLVRNKKYEDAADILLLMKTVEFKDAEKEKYSKLFESVMPLASKAAYDQGYKLYNSKKYKESLEKLEKVQVYEPEFKRMDAAFYYMGRCCQILNDSRSAVALFQQLIENYPKSTYAKSANARLKELTQKP